MRKNRWILLGLVVLFLAAGFTFFIVPGRVEDRMNRVVQLAPLNVSERAEKLHQSAFIADLHADSLLWKRDLLQRSRRGHVDIPRLEAGNVALQIFSVVTKTPSGLNIHRNESTAPDDTTKLAILQLWPTPTWNSLKERALYQATRLHGFEVASQGRLSVVRYQEDVKKLVDRHVSRAKRNPGEERETGGMLAIEGAHCLEGKVENLAALDEAGYRLIGLTHFFDNEFAGSAHGMQQGGLTPLGIKLVEEMEKRNIFVDLAHSSAKTIDDTLRIAKRPVVVSHTGVKGTCGNPRNLTDLQLKRIASTGGVIGIGYWPEATCGDDVRAIVRAISHAVRVVGIDHVGLGSDFDGTTTMPIDASQLAQLTQGLLDAEFSDDDIRKVLGGNVRQLLLASLPSQVARN